MKNLLKFAVISTLLIIACSIIGACGGGAEQFVQGQGQIDINVTDTSGTALSTVTIQVRESPAASGGVVKNTYITDANGYYKFLGTVGTNYYFTFSKTGYTTSAEYLKTPQLTATGTLNVQLVPNATTLTITTTSPLAAGTTGTAYGPVTLNATGGTAPYTWALATGSTLPAGLSLTAGSISGTPTAAGTFNFSIKVTDSATPTANTLTKAFSITVTAPGTPLTITTTTLSAATFGSAYSQTLAASGGSGAYTWSVTAGTLPAGLNLNASTGSISGTPTAPAAPIAATSNFTIGVTGAVSGSTTKAFTITGNLSASASSGKTIYDANCAGCHGLGIYDTTTGGGPNLGGLGAATLTTALNTRFAGGISHNGTTLTATQISDMLAFLSLY